MVLNLLTQSPSCGSGNQELVNFTNEYDLSPLAESYKFISTILELKSMEVAEAKTLLVTSAMVKEGKTTTATNLAISVAEEGKSVILVDSDLRGSSLPLPWRL